MRPTPNEIIRGVRELLRTEIGPELKSERATRSLRKIMGALRDVDWNEAGFQLARENAALKALAFDAIAWIGETNARKEAFGAAAQALSSIAAAPSSNESFAQVRDLNLAIRAALAVFIEIAAQRRPTGDERRAADSIRKRIAAALATLLD